MTSSLLLKMAIEIVDLPIFSIVMLVYQRVPTLYISYYFVWLSAVVSGVDTFYPCLTSRSHGIQGLGPWFHGPSPIATEAGTWLGPESAKRAGEISLQWMIPQKGDCIG